MGFLKDIRKLTKQARQMGVGSGVDTGMRGMLRQAPGMIHQAGDALAQVQQGKAEGDRLRAAGVPGRAVLLRVKDTGMTIGGTTLAAARENPVADLELEVDSTATSPTSSRCARWCRGWRWPAWCPAPSCRCWSTLPTRSRCSSTGTPRPARAGRPPPSPCRPATRRPIAGRP